MARTISFQFADFPKEIVATLEDEAEPECAQKVWVDLAEPLKMWPQHTTSTGDWFSAKGRQPATKQVAGTQAVPIGKPKLMCDIEQGSIVLYGTKALGFCYGPDVTEPLVARGPVIARVTNIQDFYEAGLHVWDAQYRTHKLVVITARRHGN
jgi:hypothetical protein